MENKFDNLSHEQKLKVSLFNEVRKICDEVGDTTKFKFDKKSMNLISELTWRKLQTYGEDLEAFAKHAKRTTVSNEDVKLLVRKNSDLKAHIGKLSDELNAAKEPRKSKQKKDVEAAGASTDGTSTAASSRAASPGFDEPMFTADDAVP